MLSIQGYFIIVFLSVLSIWPIRFSGRIAGWRLIRKAKGRRQAILASSYREREDHQENERVSSKADDTDWVEVDKFVSDLSTSGGRPSLDWTGIVGFFHPFCNAGGGGERVLWAAIKATQKRWPNAICIVYTGDHDATKSTILERVASRFNIHLYPPTVVFLYLSTRHWVHRSKWPHFTLLGQSLGSLILGYDAFSLLVPDILIDTMGYSFTLALSKFFFPKVPTGAYVHYPTISTDMLSSLDASLDKGVNAGLSKGLRGFIKRRYWHAFAYLYAWSGQDVDVVMTNSSWTQAHISFLWDSRRTKHGKPHPINVVFPPVAVDDVQEAFELEGPKVRPREKILLYVAQFRPEKNHDLILRSFARMFYPSATDTDTNGARLVLIGSVRDSDDSKRVYLLRLLAHELKIGDKVRFICDASWPDILDWLQKSWVGVNGMWNEHFGIGVVEYQAAGLICVVNDSGGPKADIVVGFDGEPTGNENGFVLREKSLTIMVGFHASSEEEYASCFAKALSMPEASALAMRKRARASSKRFTDEAFATRWAGQLGLLIELQQAIIG